MDFTNLKWKKCWKLLLLTRDWPASRLAALINLLVPNWVVDRVLLTQKTALTRVCNSLEKKIASICERSRFGNDLNLKPSRFVSHATAIMYCKFYASRWFGVVVLNNRNKAGTNSIVSIIYEFVRFQYRKDLYPVCTTMLGSARELRIMFWNAWDLVCREPPCTQLDIPILVCWCTFRITLIFKWVFIG